MQKTIALFQSDSTHSFSFENAEEVSHAEGHNRHLRSEHKHTWERMEPLQADSNAVYTQQQLVGAPTQVPTTDHTDLFSSKGKIKELTFYKPLLENAFIDSLQQKIEIVPFRPQGIAGDPVPYRFRSDDFVTTALMLSFFLMTYVISRSRHYLKSHIKNFFSPREHKDIFAPRTQNELRGQLYLIVQLCFTLGVLMFDYIQSFKPDVFNSVSPYKILLVASSICGIFYFLKIVLYYIVNTVFFDRKVTSQWNDTYLMSVLTMGVILFPVALLVVYFDVDFDTMLILFFSVYAFVKLLLFYKCFHIFSEYRLHFLHIILYLCALELFPPLVLWRALNYALNALVTID